ncbi:MAG: hypothetical protein ACSLFJ_05230, partial [Immundisolibacter sp.]
RRQAALQPRLLDPQRIYRNAQTDPPTGSQSLIIIGPKKPGRSQWAAYHYTVFGKLRPLIRAYMADAKAGDWDAAQSKWLSLRPASAFIEDMTVWELMRTGTYASAFTILKPWYDAIGLKGGHVLGPVAEVPQQRREWLAGKLKELGIA